MNSTTIHVAKKYTSLSLEKVKKFFSASASFCTTSLRLFSSPSAPSSPSDVSVEFPSSCNEEPPATDIACFLPSTEATLCCAALAAFTAEAPTTLAAEYRGELALSNQSNLPFNFLFPC